MKRNKYSDNEWTWFLIIVFIIWTLLLLGIYKIVEQYA